MFNLDYIGGYSMYMEMQGTSNSACDLPIPTITSLLSVPYLSGLFVFFSFLFTKA